MRGDVDGEAPVGKLERAAEQHPGPGRGDGVGRTGPARRARPGSISTAFKGVIRPSPRCGIGVELVDQLGDGLLAVANDVRRLAASGRDEPAVDDQEAVVGSRHELSRRTRRRLPWRRAS